MKPRRLEIEGLRSYRKKQVVEFQPQGLLAITGSTGAGKSSILEAMMFALYGVYSGNSKSNKELIGDRSDEMKVTLEFEVGGELYTAHRAVARKGPGSFAFMKGAQVLATEATKMTAEVTRTLGLDEEQFKKTIFLPQGAFQNFLTSKTKERIDLLKRLLQVEALDHLESRVQLWLADVREKVARAEGQRSQLPADPRLKLQQDGQQLQQAQLEWQQRQQCWELWSGQQRQLEQQEFLQQQLELRWQGLQGFEDLQNFDEQAWAALRQQLEEERQQLDSRLQECEQGLQDCQERSPRWSSQELRLSQQHWNLAQRTRSQLTQWEEEVQTLQQEYQSLQAQGPALQERGQQVAHLLQQAQAQEERAQAQQRLIQERQRWLERMQNEAGSPVQQRRQALEEGRQVWRQGELARLCQHLEEDQPCPLCGQSLPPEWQPPHSPGEVDLEALEQAWLEAQQQQDRYQHALDQLQALPEPDPDCPALDRCQAEVAQMLQQVAQVEAESQTRQRELLRLQQRLDQLQQRLQQARTQHSQQEEELRQKFGADVEAGLQQAEQSRSHWEEEHLRWRHAKLAAAESRTEWQSRWDSQVQQPQDRTQFLRQRCAQVLGVEGPLSLADLLQQWGQAQQDLLQQRQQAEQQRQQLQQGLRQSLQQQQLADIEQAQRWLDEAREALGRARHQVELSQQQCQFAEKLDQRLGPARLRLEQLQTLARLMGHQRSKGTRLTFPQWYLQRRQAELLELASHHLQDLSGGQFRFEPELEEATSLRVMDLFSGVPRSVNTLSGGETFLASLSLAVALAEMIGRRGGKLQALFLDEGFGTLSSECLDRALTALEQLALQGRLIGIISHVPLIAERIEHCWLVRKTPAGSEIVRADEEIKRMLVRQELAAFDPQLHPLFS